MGFAASNSFNVIDPHLSSRLVGLVLTGRARDAAAQPHGETINVCAVCVVLSCSQNRWTGEAQDVPSA